MSAFGSGVAEPTLPHGQTLKRPPQNSPAEGTADCFSIANGLCAPVPCFETHWIAGRSSADEVVKVIAMLLPSPAVESVTARSGATAPFVAYSDGLLAVPDWRTVPPAGSISYQRTIEPAPPATVCSVHTAGARWVGSSATMVGPSLPSPVSSS